jgi:alkanesulfonate monooxygenase SsuD/methylene tetrahydromethanopterin reductase-like flavin-dependent oxidoreductase (luciferase family)
MSTTIEPQSAQSGITPRDRQLVLGFHTRVSFPSGHARQGLRDGIRLFQEAENLGYDRGWVYQRHFDNYLASPLVYLPVVAHETSRIGIGTAIIGIRYEDPIHLAEAAATADLLTDGRLQIGLGTGQGGFDQTFGQEPNDGRAQSLERLDKFLEGIRGQVVGEIGEPALGLIPGTPLTVRPDSPTLPGRVWYGAGSIESAHRVAARGLRLLLSTILTGDLDDYNGHQANIIAAYRDAYQGDHEPRTSVSRSILPATSKETARLYADYDAERRKFGPAASRPAGALQHDSSVLAKRFTMSPAIHGDPDQVTEQLLADPAVQAADELIAFLPPAFGLEQSARLIKDIVETVAPSLGWKPGAASIS